jgi:hypothetical protein
MVRSFGSPASESDDQDDGEPLRPLPADVPSPGRVALAVDLVLTDESLEAVEAQLTSLIARAVLAGFAAAAMEQAN